MNEWISVEDRLPDNAEKGIDDCCTYLCFIPNPYGKDYQIKPVVWMNNLFQGFPAGATIITHWMPLPEPPNDKL